MAYFLQLVFAGIALGCIYALIGLGFSIIFKASEVINFAQGELLLVGAYVVSSGVFNWHLNFLVSVLLGVVVTVLIGLLFERFVLQRMIGRPVFSILMITIGLDTILRTGVIVGWGSNPLPAAAPYTAASGFNIAGVHLGANDLLTIIVTIVLCAMLFYFFQYTRYGLAMRATALEPGSCAGGGYQHSHGLCAGMGYCRRHGHHRRGFSCYWFLCDGPNAGRRGTAGLPGHHPGRY